MIAYLYVLAVDVYIAPVVPIALAVAASFCHASHNIIHCPPICKVSNWLAKPLHAMQMWGTYLVQWTLANPNSLGPEPIQISEIFGLVKATAATCVIVTTPYLHSVLGSLGSLPLLHVHRTHNTAPKRSFSTLLLHLTRKT